MKHHIYILSVAMGMALTACDLDLKPENGLTYANSFDTERELNATTSSIHFFLNTAISEDHTFSSAGILADEMSDGDQLRQWNPNTVKMGQDWVSLYNTIFEANLLIDHIDQTRGLSRERRNYHQGQAEFALGICYLTLVQRYGDVPLVENSKTIKAYGCTPQLQVLDYAIAHAEKGLEMLPTHDKLTDFKGQPLLSRQFASKGSCAALLAHLYAWRGSVIECYGLAGDAKADYQKSVGYASMLIDGKAGAYSLCSSAEELCELLSDPTKTNPEAVFVCAFDANRSAYSTTPNLIAMSYRSWPMDITQKLGDLPVETNVRLYKSTIDKMYAPDDGRREAYFYKIDEPHEVDGRNYALMNKFRTCLYTDDQFAPGGKSFRTINCDYVYWRLADFYLLRAECQAKLGNDGAAVADLNVIRRRAGAPAYPAPTDTEGLRKAVFREREKEFIYENDARYFDIVRNNYVATELEGKFKTLTPGDIRGGALVLPVPEGAYKDNNQRVVNTVIRQKPYWMQFM